MTKICPLSSRSVPAAQPHLLLPISWKQGSQSALRMRESALLSHAHQAMAAHLVAVLAFSHL